MHLGWKVAGRLTIIGAVCVLAACQQPATPALSTQSATPVNGVGYVVFNAPIFPKSRDLFMADVDKLLAAGAKEIRVGINSPGGDIDAAQGMVDYMQRLHTTQNITFKSYNIGMVASAASYVFLNAQTRFSAARGAFVFHAAGLMSNGLVNAQILREQADKIDAYERTVLATLKARTKLTDAEALTYVRRTVILSSDDARRDGVVDSIADFTVPKEARAWIITSKPTKPPTAPQPAAPASG